MPLTEAGGRADRYILVLGASDSPMQARALLLAATLLTAGCAPALPPSPAARPRSSAPAADVVRARPSPATPAPSPLTPAATPAGSPPIPSPLLASAAPRPAPASPLPIPWPSRPPDLAHLVGQKLIVAMDGTIPSAGLLARIRRGEVGGVILFGRNITTARALTALTASLRAAAAAGGQPAFLIAVDQEGGDVKRIGWAPPWLSAPQMGEDGRASTAQGQGALTGSALRGLGIDVDLAPVADVPGSTASFMYLAGRTFSFSAGATASLATAFAVGLMGRGVAATMKHFPGIGDVDENTDVAVVDVTASRVALAPGLLPYRAGIAAHVPLVMLSNASYQAYDPWNAAGWSPAVGRLLRGLGFTGVTISDSLDGAAASRGVTVNSLAVRAAVAGTDLILTTGSEASSGAVYTSLLDAARHGTIPLTTLQASYRRILALKARYRVP